MIKRTEEDLYQATYLRILSPAVVKWASIGAPWRYSPILHHLAQALPQPEAFNNYVYLYICI